MIIKRRFESIHKYHRLIKGLRQPPLILQAPQQISILYPLPLLLAKYQCVSDSKGQSLHYKAGNHRLNEVSVLTPLAHKMGGAVFYVEKESGI
jgi:hypothetical protein